MLGVGSYFGSELPSSQNEEGNIISYKTDSILGSCSEECLWLALGPGRNSPMSSHGESSEMAEADSLTPGGLPCSPKLPAQGLRESKCLINVWLTDVTGCLDSYSAHLHFNSLVSKLVLVAMVETDDSLSSQKPRCWLLRDAMRPFPMLPSPSSDRFMVCQRHPPSFSPSLWGQGCRWECPCSSGYCPLGLG